MTRLGRSLSLAGIAAGLASLSLATNHTIGAQQETGAPCAATLSVSQYPDFVPAYIGWESLFADVAGQTVSPSSLGVIADADRLRVTATRAVQRAGDIRSGSRGVDNDSTEAAAAATVLAQRDEFVRTAKPDVVEALSIATRGRAPSVTIDLGGHGQMMETPNGMKCVLTVDGRNSPHLIPEVEYWRNYFSLYASVTDQKDAAGQYSAMFLATLRRSRLNLPRDRQLVVLQLAEKTDAAVRQAELAGGLHEETARIVLAARTLLLRTLSPTEWVEVQKDVARTREGTFFRFPVY